MASDTDHVRRLLKQVAVLRVVLCLSFLVAVGATVLTLTPSLIQLSSYDRAVSGPVAQPSLANATAATTTFLYSNTASLPGGYSVVTGPLAPYPFNYYGVTALLSWGVFGAALIWRGRVRSVWCQSRFSYDTFRLFVKMRGAQTRVTLMHALNSPKNKLQLATALGIDWKAVDKHVQVLEKNGLIHATSANGTATFYEITEKGKDLMQVLEQLAANTTSE